MKTILIIILTIILIAFIVYLKYFRAIKPKENRFKFVQFEENGKIRELYAEEIEYLSEKFHPNDGGRPYIKTNYEDLTPDEKYGDLLVEIEFRKM